LGPKMWMPRTLSVALSARILTSPSLSCNSMANECVRCLSTQHPVQRLSVKHTCMALAREFAAKGKTPLEYAMPFSLSCSSVWPTVATCKKGNPTS
jgi:hypothetical protein